MKRMVRVDRLLWRGSHPVTPADFQELKEKGIKLIINLESGLWEFSKRDVNFEVEKAAEYGINVTHIHMGFIMPPKVHELETALKLIKMHNDKEEAVYFHCYSGVDRTGFVAAWYLFVEGMMLAEGVIENLWQNGFHWWYFFWVPTLKNYMYNGFCRK